MSEYISIKEFSKLANVSRQTIYRRLDKDLKNFTQTINGNKKISKAALIMFEKTEDNEELSHVVTEENPKKEIVTPDETAKNLGFNNFECNVLSHLVRTNSEHNTKIDNVSERLTELINKVDTLQNTINQVSNKPKPKFLRWILKFTKKE